MFTLFNTEPAQVALLPILACAALGLLSGWLHFGSLRWLSRRLIEPAPDADSNAAAPHPPALPWARLLLVQLGRLALLVALGYLAARQGSLPLLAWLAGLLLARASWLRRARRLIRLGRRSAGLEKALETEKRP